MKKLISSGLSEAEVIAAYRIIKLSRILDQRLWQLTRIGKSTFVISGQGAEVGQVAMTLPFNYQEDYFLPYYRDLAACLQWGMDAKDIILGALGKVDDPNSGGRQMPNHYSSALHNIVSQGSAVTTQYPLATGVAYSALLRDENYVTLVTVGEGSTAEGDFHEALNFAGLKKLPIIFVIENNNYAISTRSSDEGYSGKRLVDHADAYNIKGNYVDGRDFTATYLAFKEAITYAKSGKGPVLIELMVDRLTPHSSDDDHTIYRTEADLDELQENDVILHFERLLIEEGYLTQEDIDNLTKEIHQEVNQATDDAENSLDPDPETIFEHLYATNTVSVL